MDRSELVAHEKKVVTAYKPPGSAQYLKALKRLLKESEEAEDWYFIGKTNLRIAICYFDLGNRINILPYAVKAVDVFEKLNNRDMLSASYNLLGLAYRAMGDYCRAVGYYERALAIIRSKKKPMIRKDVIYSNIAESCFLMGAYKKCISLMLRCIPVIQTQHPEDHTQAVIYAINLSDAYEGIAEMRKANQTLEDARHHAEALEREVLLWGYYARRACVFYKLGLLEEAKKYADLTIKSVNAGYDSYEFHRDFEKIAKFEVMAGDITRAQCFADILTNYADANKNTIDLIISKRVQANIYDYNGEQDRALELYKELNTLYEKHVNEQRLMKYESQKMAEAASREIANLMLKMRISEEKAERDALSGLMNRSGMVTVSDRFCKKAIKKGCTLGGIFVDIDYFKEYNDTYGHSAGDDAIRLIARACLEEESEQVKFFRYGGDEFFGIALDYSDKELEQLALRIHRKVRTSGVEHIKNPNGQQLTVSVGMVNILMKNSGSTVLDVIKYSDNALYYAKKAGNDIAIASCVGIDTGFEFRILDCK